MPDDLLTIDGSQGEGGGQILRSSLALSAWTGRPFRIHSIRKSRRKPGLARQHLTCVHAAAAVCGARLEGDALRSTELVFFPGAVRPGRYRFDVGTAGSANLVLQTVLPPLMVATGPSEVTVTGGTHNPLSPPTDFLQRVFLPQLTRMGPEITLALHRWGFMPAGGGEIHAAIQPSPVLTPIELLERGQVVEILPTAVLSRLPLHIGERELDAACKALRIPRQAGRIQEVARARSAGNALMIEIRCEHQTELFTGFGQRGVRAERVASRVARQARRWLDSGTPVGPFLADQLLLPMAMAGGGRFLTTEPDAHTPTNAAVIQAFLGVTTRIERAGEREWSVELSAQGAAPTAP